jgi:fluoroacetyl-CoA thioesterase
MRVAPDMLAPRLARFFPNFGDMREALATMAMVGFVESACLKCIDGHLDPGEHSVGVEVRTQVEFIAVDGRRLIFAVKVSDDGGFIGEGRHQLAAIDVARFLERVQAKAKGSARPAAP